MPKKSVFLVRTDPPNLGTAQKSQNSQNWSTWGLESAIKNTSKNVLLDNIQEPLERGFQNTPYFSHIDTFSTFGGSAKFGKISKT